MLAGSGKVSEMNRFIRVGGLYFEGRQPCGQPPVQASQIAAIAGGLDKAGVPFIEASHGDGLGGSSINYGRAKLTDEQISRAASAVIEKGALTVLLLPGIGTQEDLRMAEGCGAKAVRVATHVTEADIAEQHIGLGKKMGMTAFGFLMLAHMSPPEAIVEQAKLFESYGCDVVYIADSAGAMLPSEESRPESRRSSMPSRFRSVFTPMRAWASPSQTGSLQPKRAPQYVDGTCRGLGGGAGNAQTEVPSAFCTRRDLRRDRFLRSHGRCGGHSGTGDAKAPGNSECFADAGICRGLFELSVAHLPGR